MKIKLTITIERYDPRRDKDELRELFDDFMKNKSYFQSNWNKFDYELNKRLLNLQYRNSMVMAKEDDRPLCLFISRFLSARFVSILFRSLQP